jgi:nucleotidyltransferase/DNA polymerase involved in DNA repair
MTSVRRGTPPLEPPLEGRPLPPTPERWVIYVDLDAYYVACEIRDRPELAGKPVIVGPPPSAGPTRGVVLSASYEARPFGVRSALPVQIAARLCPQAIWVPPDFEKYERVSREVRALLRTFSPDVVPFSIDEAVVGTDAAGPEEARAIAERIQRALVERLGLPSSLGVATTRLVAKMATDAAKPGRIVVVPPGEVARFVAPLPVRAVPGVGPKTEQRLGSEGITTIGELAAKRPAEIGRWLGAFGRELVALARGEPVESPLVETGPRSRSTDRTFAADVTSWPELESAVRELAGELARALDREGLRYGSVGVGLRWSDFSRTQRVRSLSGASEGPASMAERAVRLAREVWEAESATQGRAVRTVSVRAERLTGRHLHQVSLDEFAGSAGARR